MIKSARLGECRLHAVDPSVLAKGGDLLLPITTGSVDTMSALNIHLPDSLRSRVEARAAESGFDSVEAYVEAVLLADVAGGPATEDAQLEALLLKRVDGPLVDTDEAGFRPIRDRLTAQLGGHANAGRARVLWPTQLT